MLRKLSAIDTVIIHCADTANGDARRTIADIDEWHKERKFTREPDIQKVHAPKWLHVGYHRVIHIDGKEELGRSLLEIGAHAEGHNSRSIGICLIGRDQFTLKQWETLRHSIRVMQLSLVLPRVIGHRNVNPNKTCPGFDVAAWLRADMEPLSGHIFPEEKIRWTN